MVAKKEVDVPWEDDKMKIETRSYYSEVYNGQKKSCVS